MATRGTAAHPNVTLPKHETAKTLEQQGWYPLWKIFRGTYPKREALYALLAATVAIDGEVSSDERLELDALVRRSRELSKLSIDALNRMRGKIDPLLVPEKFSIHKVVDKACASLGSWKTSAYAHCVDLALADRKIPVVEQELLIRIAKKLRLDEKLAERIMRQLIIKNEQDAASQPPSEEQGGEADEAKPGYGALAEAFRNVPGSMPTADAFYAFLSLAVVADDKEAPEERDELAALAARTRTLAKLSKEELARMKDALAPQLAKDKRESLFQNALASLPKRLRPAVFAQCVEIVFADRKFVRKEQQFIEKLRQAFEITATDAEEMIDVLKLKNAH